MAASPPPPLPAAIPAAAVPVPPPIRPQAAAAPGAEAAEEFNLGRGILGAALGAGLGAAVMYGFFVGAGFRFPLMGTGIGALTGLGARMLARGTGSTLGIIAGAIALLSTAGTFYLMFGKMAVISLGVSVYFAYRVAA